MTIMIFGADGQLGRDLQDALSAHTILPVRHRDVDIVDREAVENAVKNAAPQWIINSAAMTHVDRCETDDVTAFEINALGARHVAAASQSCKSRLIQVSTDYVFDGSQNKPYVETDLPRPINAYGLSKLAGELFVQSLHHDHYIVRTSGLYGVHRCRGKDSNFVDTMLRLAGERDVLRVVDDEVLTPTYSADLARRIGTLIDAEPPFGLYHATNDGACSWYEFAAEIFRLAGNDVTLERTTAAEWSAPARRPAYSVLENAGFSDAGMKPMPHWKDALQRYLGAKKTA